MILRQRSFRLQLLAVTMLTSVVSLVIAGIFFFGHEVVNFRQQTIANLLSVAQIVGANSAAALTFDDATAATDTLAALRAEPGIQEAGLYRTNGTLFARYVRAGRSSAPAPVALRAPGAYSEQAHLTVFQEVRNPPDLAGFVYVRAGMDALHDRLSQYAVTSGLILLLGILSAILLAMRLNRTVAHPILDLTRTVRQVSDTRDYSLRAGDGSPGRTDELDVLTRGFNEMLGQIQQRDRSLHDAHDQLEQKIELRTRALRAEMAQRVEAQEKLEQQKRQAQQYLDIAAVMFVALNNQAEVLMANRKCCEITGYSEAELIGANWIEKIIPPEHRPDVAFAFQGIEAGETATFQYHENRIVRKDGEERLIAWYNTAIRDEAGRIVGTLSSGSDITDRRQMEHDLEETNRRLSSALDEVKTSQERVIQDERLRALGQMASGIAHDFNNALVPILGYSDYILSDPAIFSQKDDLKQMIQDILRAAQDARDVVRRLREFYRPADESEFAPVNLNELVAKAVALTRPRWREEMAAAGIAIEVKTDLGELPTIPGSESQLSQALINLILNAVDAMRAGGVLTLSTRLSTPWLVLDVADTGEGMTEEVRRRCLEPFFSTKRERGGTGLGLPIVFGAVQRHKGQVEIISQPGLGTTIRLRFPVASQPAVEPAKPAARPAAFSFGGMRVLVVDDDPRSQTILHRYLTTFDCRVEVAQSGLEAMRKIREDRFDLLLTDRAMPGISGDDLARSARASHPDLPVIMVTGFGDIIETAGDPMPENVSAVVTKPVRMNELGEAISRLIAAASRPPPVANPLAKNHR